MSAAAAKGRLLAIIPSDQAHRRAFAAQQSARAGMQARRFEAAAVNRLTASWKAGSASLDDELRSDLDALRNRSRDLRKNDAYAAKFVRMVRNNVVGAQGFVLQAAATDANGKSDDGANTAIENAWYEQCRPGNFDVTGRFSGDDFWRTAVENLAVDGEILIRIARGARYGKFGFQLQLLDPARIDTSYNLERVGTRNAIVMGVEIDVYGKPVAYHLFTSLRASVKGRERERVPAEDILHRFMPMGLEQTRGVPWMHAAMHLLRQLGGYREAAVIAARIGASKMGFYTRKGDEPPPNNGTDAAGNFIQNAEPGSFDVLPDGYGLDKWDPAYPHDQFDVFCKAALRGIGSGWGVAYPSLGNDLEGVNFSSIRSGVLEERDEWMVIQAWLIGTTVSDVFGQWLRWSLLGGKILLANGSALPAGKADKFLSHSFQPRRWAWVDPQKDIQASVIAIENLLASPQQIAAQTGRDIVDVLDDIQRFQQMVAERGLKLPEPKPAAPAQVATAEDEEQADS